MFNPVYDELTGFHEDRAGIRQGNLWGYMDPNGNMISEFEFRWVGPFEHGIAKVLLGPIHNDYDNHYAYINESGAVVWIES
ncbi:MAG: WG repeat-containing protein [Bacteroidota bacterium]